MVIAIMGRKNGQLQMLVVDLGELIPKNHLLRKIFAQFIVPYHKIPLFVGFRQLIAEFYLCPLSLSGLWYALYSEA